MPNLLNPSGNPELEKRLRPGLLDFFTALVSGGPGVPGDIAQGVQDTSVGLLNARMNSIDPTGRVRAMSGQYEPLQAQELPYTSANLQRRLGGNPESPASVAGLIGAPDVTDVSHLAGVGKAASGLLSNLESGTRALMHSQELVPGGLLAQSLFHGTPHKFEKFALDKIGTGEGAQAYGHGLYFAENPGVARSYQSDLSSGAYLIDGERITVKRGAVQAHEAAASGNMTKLENIVRRAETAAENMRGVTSKFADWAREDALESARVLRNVKNGAKYEVAKGHLYEVDVPDEITNKMLDWDAPLSEQPESVRKVLDPMFDTGNPVFQAEQIKTPGSNLYSQLSKKFGGDEKASAWLNEAGIPGIRFFDGGSRPNNITDQRMLSLMRKHNDNAVAAIDEFMRGVHNTPAKKDQIRQDLLKSVEGRTRNIVVFNPDDINTVKRDGETVFNKVDEVSGGLLGGGSSQQQQSQAIGKLFDGEFSDLSKSEQGAFVDFINDQRFFRGEQGASSAAPRSRANRFFTDTESLATRYVDGKTGNIVESGFNIKNPLVLNGRGKSKGLLGTDSSFLRRAREGGHDSVILFEVDDAPNGFLGSGTPQTSTVVVGLDDSVIKDTAVRPFSKIPNPGTR